MARILHITDPHVVLAPDLVSNTLDTAAIFGAAIDAILDRWETFGDVDAVVATGDVTDNGDLASYQSFRAQIERLPAPCFVIPGNHDLREPMRACFGDCDFMPETGKINWMHDFPDLRLIGLDTLLPDQGGGILDPDTLGFLETHLQSAGDKPILVAMHHPPFQTGLKFMDRIGLHGAEHLGAVLNHALGEVRIICGHVHSTIIGTVGGHVAITGASLVSTFLADFRDQGPVGFAKGPTGYMIHDWNNGFCSTCVPLLATVDLHPFR